MKNIVMICALFLLSGCSGTLDGGSKENRRTLPENDESSKPRPPNQPDLNPPKPAWRIFQSSAFNCEKLDEEVESPPAGIEESVKVENLGSKKLLNVLFLGGSSVGKSMLINIFYNQIKERSYHDARELPVPNVVTEEVQVFRVENEDYVVNLIDTPGLSDRDDDFERAEKSARKIGDAVARIKINAIAVVVLGGTNIIRSRGTDNVLEMMPMKLSKNMVGIFNRAHLRKNALEYSRTQFADVFLRNTVGLKPETYLIDGTEFSPIDDDQELSSIQKQHLEELWKKDSLTVKQFLSDAAKKSPVEGKEIWKIQRIKEKMKGQVTELGSLLSKDLYVTYVQQRKKNALWKPRYKKVPSFITHGELEYKDTLVSEVICEDEIKRLEEEQRKRLCRVVALETQLEPLVMATILNPYLVYLRQQKSDDREPDFELSAYQYWERAYDHLIQK